MNVYVNWENSDKNSKKTSLLGLIGNKVPIKIEMKILYQKDLRDDLRDIQIVPETEDWSPLYFLSVGTH